MTIVRYELTGFYNFRDGGGLAARDGRLRTMRLLRSDQPESLDGQDIDFLRDLPLAKVVDLRTEMEVKTSPSAFKEAGFALERHPIVAGSAASMVEGDMTVAKMYQEMLHKGGKAFARAVAAAAAGLGNGSVIVHCTAGKDRTGITIALIQELLGASREDIIDSYALTGANLAGPWVDEKMAAIAKFLGEKEAERLEPLLAQSPPEAMSQALSYVDQNFGGALGYLQSHGLDEGVVGSLRDALIV